MVMPMLNSFAYNDHPSLMWLVLKYMYWRSLLPTLVCGIRSRYMCQIEKLYNNLYIITNPLMGLMDRSSSWHIHFTTISSQNVQCICLYAPRLLLPLCTKLRLYPLLSALQPFYKLWLSSTYSICSLSFLLPLPPLDLSRSSLLLLHNFTNMI